MSHQPQSNLVQEIIDAIKPLVAKHPEEFLKLTQMAPAELMVTVQSALKGAATTAVSKSD